MGQFINLDDPYITYDNNYIENKDNMSNYTGKDNKEDCIESDVSSRLWPSGFSRKAWEYNVELAKEAVKELKRFKKIADKIVALEEEYAAMSDEELASMTGKLKEMLEKLNISLAIYVVKSLALFLLCFSISLLILSISLIILLTLPIFE